MIPEEKEIFTSEDALYDRMRWVGPAEVATMIDSFDQKMKDFEKDYFDLCKSVSRLLRTRAGTLGEERVSQWRAQKNTVERDVKDYTLRMYSQASQVRASQNPVQAQFQQMDLSGQSGTNSYQAELLALKRRSQQEKEAEKAERLDETTRENEEKKAGFHADVKMKCKVIQDYVDDLSEKVNKVQFQAWKNEPDLSVSLAMKNIENWEKDLKDIVSIRIEMDSIVARNNLVEDYDILEPRLNFRGCLMI